MEKESAISRNILLALILSAVIIIIAVAIVFILFPPEPDVIPVFTANAERSGTLVYLYHDGGNQLNEGTTFFRINSQVVPKNAITFLHGQNWPWTEGETIRIDYPPAGTPESIEVLYSRGGDQLVVYSYQFGSPSVTPTSTQIVTVTTTPGTIPPTVVGTIPAPSRTLPGNTPGPSQTVPSIQPTVTGGVIPQPPSALFSGSPRQGEVPLKVQFSDLSTGVPESWLWNFGDGVTASDKNPEHEYILPGIYTVSLTVRNAAGTSSTTETGYISAGQPPLALFQSIPRVGPAPLLVQFTDLSSGAPDQWDWSFGDGSGSTEKNPSHLYLEPGNYTVRLTVTNNYGSNTRIQTSDIGVTPTATYEIYLDQSSNGYLLPDGYFQFVVTGPGASIKIGGTEYLFKEGDLIQLFPGDVSSGSISVNQNGIVGFSFSDVRMFENGDLVRTGIVSGIKVPSYAGLSSTFSIVIPPVDSSMQLFIDGEKVSASGAGKVVISGIGGDANGGMYLSVRTRDLSFRGGAGSVMIG